MTRKNKNSRKSNQGLSGLGIVGIIAAIIIVAGAGYYFTKSGSTSGVSINQNATSTNPCALATTTVNGVVSTSSPCGGGSSTSLLGNACAYITDSEVSSILGASVNGKLNPVVGQGQKYGDQCIYMLQTPPPKGSKIGSPALTIPLGTAYTYSEMLNQGFKPLQGVGDKAVEYTET